MENNQGQPSIRRRLNWSYIAGFVDADGCITAYKKQADYKSPITNERKYYPEKRYYKIEVSIGQHKRERWLLEELQKKCGGNLGEYKDAIAWRLSNLQAYEFLKKIHKKLLLKRNQAILAMRFQENILKWKNKMAYSKNEKLPSKVIRYRECLMNQIHQLNQNRKSSSIATTESKDPERGSDSLNNRNDKSIEQNPEEGC